MKTLVLRAFERHVVRFAVAVRLETHAASVADDLQATAWGVPGDTPVGLASRLHETAHLVGLLEGLDVSIAADPGEGGSFDVPAERVTALQDLACRLAADAAGPESRKLWTDLALAIHREAIG